MTSPPFAYPARKRRRRRSPRFNHPPLGRDHVSRRISLSITKSHAIARRSSSVPRPSPRLSSRVAVVPNLSRRASRRARVAIAPLSPPSPRAVSARSRRSRFARRIARSHAHAPRFSSRANRALAQKPPHRSSSPPSIEAIFVNLRCVVARSRASTPTRRARRARRSARARPSVARRSSLGARGGRPVVVCARAASRRA